MAKNTAKPEFNAQIFEQATAWFVDFSEGEVDAAGREAFNKWLRTSPEHVRAYLQISAFWEDAELLNKDGAVDNGTLIARALADTNVVPLTILPVLIPSPAKAGEGQGGGGIKRPFLLAASVALFLIAATTTLWLYATRSPIYTTATGEQRSLTLPDGSTVNLNSRSQIKLRFTDTERTITLTNGQALFAVAKDSARPFTVISGDTRVRAVGTQFDVYKKASGTVVTVLEGRVALSPPTRAGEGQGGGVPATILSAGQQAVVTPRAVTAPRQANIITATAWTQKKLVFDSTPLTEVVEEFNRYNTRRLILDDTRLEDFHISGVFSSSDPERLIAFLRQRFGVTVEESSGDIRISRQ